MAPQNNISAKEVENPRVLDSGTARNIAIGLAAVFLVSLAIRIWLITCNEDLILPVSANGWCIALFNQSGWPEMQKVDGRVQLHFGTNQFFITSSPPYWPCSGNQRIFAEEPSGQKREISRQGQFGNLALQYNGEHSWSNSEVTFLAIYVPNSSADQSDSSSDDNMDKKINEAATWASKGHR